MKRNILSMLLLVCLPLSYVMAQTATHYNSVKTLVARTGTTVAGNVTMNNSIATIQYFDDLGRPYQTVQHGASPSQRDLVTYQEYDASGRESASWLPVYAGSRWLEPITLDALRTQSAAIYGDSKAYSLSVLDPLDQVVEQYGPGQDWHDNNKRVKVEHLTNSANGELACRWYQSTFVRAIGIRRDFQITSQPGKEYYPPFQLYVTRTTDEDSTGVSIEFKNKLGQVLLVRQKKGTDYYDTYYLYDIYGNKRIVLPPMASDALAAAGSLSTNADGTDALSRYAYLYNYDDRNRCSSKKLPGAGWVRYEYDRGDRMICSQDEEQASKNPQLCTFYLYDDYNRPVVQGTCEFRGSIASLTSAMMITRLLYRADGGVDNTPYNEAEINPAGYSYSMRLYSPVVHTVNYYDNYCFMNLTGFNNSNFAADTPPGSTGKGMLTGTVSTVLDDSGRKIYTVYYYDEKGRMKKKVSSNLLGGYDKTTTVYTFTGQPSQVTHIHTAAGKATQTEVYTYTYDHVDREKTVTHRLNSGTTVTLANNEYDELGRLKTNRRNGHADLLMNYTYNVRSWIKSISNKYFSQTLYYNDRRANGTNIPRYNGNISAMECKPLSMSHEYNFTYDDLSRLIRADFSGSAPYSSSYCYDKHGNIICLLRSGYTGLSTWGVVDDLRLTYEGNQLLRVYDPATNPSLSMSMDFRDRVTALKEYSYDVHGNMTQDLNKGIENIEYNVLHLPKRVTFNLTSNPVHEYIYTAAGEKLAVTHRNASSQMRTDYVGNMLYEGGSLKRILVEGGYIQGTTYYFYIQDHLGNNRAVVNQNGSLLQQDHYYPYGMWFADSMNPIGQPYLYNGKELENQNGLNLYDYSSRLYDPVLGRFTSMDPLAEKYPWWSPYAYCKGNPILRVDSDGKDDYVVNSQGQISFKRSTKRTVDVLYASGQKGDVPKINPKWNNIRVFDQKILPALAQNKGSDYYDPDFFAETSRAYDAANIVTFGNENTDVEWRYAAGYRDGEEKYIIGNSCNQYGVSTLEGIYNKPFTGFQTVVDIHSHPSTPGAHERDMSIAEGKNNVSFGVYFKENKTLYEYNSKSNNLNSIKIESMKDLMKYAYRKLRE